VDETSTNSQNRKSSSLGRRSVGDPVNETDTEADADPSDVNDDTSSRQLEVSTGTPLFHLPISSTTATTTAAAAVVVVVVSAAVLLELAVKPRRLYRVLPRHAQRQDIICSPMKNEGR
jgi:hypothetical protein